MMWLDMKKELLEEGRELERKASLDAVIANLIQGDPNMSREDARIKAEALLKPVEQTTAE